MSVSLLRSMYVMYAYACVCSAYYTCYYLFLKNVSRKKKKIERILEFLIEEGIYIYMYERIKLSIVIINFYIL